MNEELLVVICIFLIGAIIGALLGIKRKMGLWKGLLLGFFLNWLGWIIIAVSDKKEGTVETPSSIKRRKILFIVLGGFLLALALMYLVALLTVPVPSGRERAPIMGIVLFGGVGIAALRKGLGIKNPERTENVLADESESLVQNPYSENGETLKPSFVLESNVQQRITIGTDNIDTSKASRKIIVEHNGGDRYTLSILDGESGKTVLQSVQMHRVSYSKIDECLSMVSDDNKGEYALNVFYKDGQVYKCVVQRKSKNIYIHYDKE